MLNVVAIMGRLARDPEMRQTTTGKNVASFRIACDRGRRDANGQSVADWIDVVAWDRQAEFVCRYFQKGSLIVVDGRLQSVSIRIRPAQTALPLKWLPTTSTLQAPRAAMQVTETAIRMPLRPTRTQRLPVRLLWRQLPATLPAMPTTSPSLMTAMTCRSDTKRSIR